jgi:hypothetical protein
VSARFALSLAVTALVVAGIGVVWNHSRTAYDASARVLWKRGSLGRIGMVDARNERVIVPVFGEFTLGSD